MRNYTKLLILILLFTSAAKAQTNVSGGIYANTTWTKANSPYIVTDTVVVFPDVVLTIEAGVTVKFDNKMRLEIRQASILSIGTVSDPITFTSNSDTATAGYWGSVYLNGGTKPATFHHSIFKYANSGIDYYSNGTLTIKHSNFTLNKYGIKTYDIGSSQVVIDTSDFSYNVNAGIDFTYSTSTISINYCNISYNNYGFMGQYHKYGNIENSEFHHNNTGLYVFRTKLNGCRISHNKKGIEGISMNIINNCIVDSNSVYGIACNYDEITNCEIRNNGIGIWTAYSKISYNNIHNNEINIKDQCCWGGSEITSNIIRNGTVGIDSIVQTFKITKNLIENHSIGIDLRNSSSTVSCNTLCNNSTYDLKYSAINNITVPNNYWCTTDSAIVRSHIYDGYVNANVGLVSFTPLDTVPCFQPAGVNEQIQARPSFYPNPFSDYVNLELPTSTAPASLTVLTMLGEKVFAAVLNQNSNKIDISELKSGIYIFQLTYNNQVIRQQFIRE